MKRINLLVALFLLTVFGIAINNETFNEYFEHKWIKDGSSFHNWMHTSANVIHTPAKKTLIVYVHIMRTSGETLKISLFNNVSYQFNPEHMDEIFAYAKQEGRVSNDETMSPARPWPIGLEWPKHVKPRPWKRRDGKRGIAHIKEAIKHGNVIQGFFSKLDVQRLRKWAKEYGRPVQMWTVLREPIERTLSLKEMIGHHRVPWPHSTDVVPKWSDFYQTPIPKVGRGSEKQHVIDYVTSYCHNGMTWQLGHQQHAAFRNISEDLAFESAKSFLEEMDYVGFFEDMIWDFPRLVNEIFPHSRNAGYYKFAYWVGTLVGWPRMRVRKHLGHVPIDQRDAVFAANKLDIKLYEWAKKRFNKENIVMFDNYIQCSIYMFFVFFLPVFACAVGIYCLCCRRPHNAENAHKNSSTLPTFMKGLDKRGHKD